MIRIELHSELDGLIDYVETEAADGSTFFEAASAKWPDGFKDRRALVIGPEGLEVDPDGDRAHTLLEDGETWQIIISPQFDPVSLALLTALALPTTPAWVSAVSLISMAAITMIGSYLLRPKLPGAGNTPYEWDDSGTPQRLSGASNQLRPGARIPDVIGIVKVYPDLIAEPFVFYDGQDQTLDELYVVSNGWVDCSDPKLHDEEVTTIGSSTPTEFYHPGDSWPSDFTVVKTNQFVAGVELPAQNEVEAGTATFTLNTSGSIDVDVPGYWDEFSAALGTAFAIADKDLNPANRKIYTVTSIVGQTLNVSPAPSVQESLVGLTFRGLSFVYGGANPIRVTPNWVFSWYGSYQSSSGGTDLVWQVRGRGATNVNYGAYRSGYIYEPANDYDGSPTPASIPASWSVQRLRISPTNPGTGTPEVDTEGLFKIGSTVDFPSGYFVTFNEGGNYNPSVPSTGYSSGIFTIPGGITNTCYFDVEFPGGLYSQEAGGIPQRREVTISIYTRWKKTDANGTTYGPWVGPTNYTFGGTTRTAQRFTQEHTYNNNEQECYFVRQTDYIPDTADRITVDAVRISGLRGKVNVNLADYGPLTVTLARIRLDTQNSLQVQRERAFNVIAQRQLVDYLGTGQLAAGTFKIKDMILHTLLSEGEYTIDQIDTDSLLSVQADLDAIANTEGQWHGIIDQTLSAEDQVRLATDIKRIIMYRRAGRIFFSRPKAGMLPTSLINSRTKLEPEKRTIGFGFANDPTHVIVRFRDATDNYNEASVQYPEGGVVDPIEQTVLGITDPTVAARLAQYTYDQTTFGRDLVEVSTGAESILLAPGDVVNVTDALISERPVEGEIITATPGTAGDVVTYDQKINSGNYRLRIRSKGADGLIEDLDVTVPENRGTFELPGVDVLSNLPDIDSQIGLLYSFTPTGDPRGDLVLITGIEPSREGPVAVAGMLYRDEMFQSDTATIRVTPAKRNRRGPVGY